MKVKYNFIMTTLLLMLSAAEPLFAGNPHEISSESPAADCLSCHTEKPQIMPANALINSKNHQADSAAFNIDGIDMCTSCHDRDDGHQVGLKLDFEVPADLPLGKKNKMTCLTCHYTHGRLSSDRPQASLSFLDGMLDSERLHKSYLLRRNNADGELCLTCHEVKEGVKNDK